VTRTSLLTTQNPQLQIAFFSIKHTFSEPKKMRLKDYYVRGGVLWGTVIGALNLHATFSFMQQNPKQAEIILMNFVPVGIVKGVAYGATWPCTLPYLAWNAHKRKQRPLINAFVPFGSTASITHHRPGWK